MRYGVRNILLVSSMYDYYIFEEDGRLYELMYREYQGLNLRQLPEITHVTLGREALDLLKEPHRFDLILLTLHVEDMPAAEFARLVRDAGVNTPIVLLAYDNSEQSELRIRGGSELFDRMFVWQGDFRLLLGIVKYIEDRLNVDHDTRLAGVQSIILIEDNIKYYSSFLPLIYAEILRHTQRLIAEGVNLSHKYLRVRARPKILLCSTYEEAWSYYSRYDEFILGVISDVDFPREGQPDPLAGLKFATRVKQSHPDVPILLQSNAAELRGAAESIGASFVLKDSPMLLQELRQFMVQYFSFGDFVFRTPDGLEVGRASDLNSLEEQLQKVPDASIKFHAERNHFSNWLKARTEFSLAHRLRPRKVSDFVSTAELREDLLISLRHYRKARERGVITDFSKLSFDPTASFARIGGGSLGGKVRGLGFVNSVIHTYDFASRFEGVQVGVPAAVALGTDVFDQFVDENNLRRFALGEVSDAEIVHRFLTAERFPASVVKELRGLLEVMRCPLAVRSSSLLEDSQYHPFAGVYATYMIPNNHPDEAVRLRQLIQAITRVFASTFRRHSKDYIKATSYRLEEEKMAVLIQRIVGNIHDGLFYPEIAGVARSFDFYPTAPQQSADGIANVALGLGKMVMDGGVGVRFCPKYPDHLSQFGSVKDILRNSQHDFFALEMSETGAAEIDELEDARVTLHSLSDAERQGTLAHVASTYSVDEDAVYDGVSRQGRRLVTLAPILKNNSFPLAEILRDTLSMATSAMGTAVEIEFAANLSPKAGRAPEFGLLQIRPLVLTAEAEDVELGDGDPQRNMCASDRVMGNGVVRDLRDVVVVDIKTFERARSRDTAEQVSALNSRLMAEGRPYVLVGVGRWGTLDPWLGIPVKWDQIAGARVIVEASFADFDVTPSQGSHFFQNITSFKVGYFTITGDTATSFIDWSWLAAQKCEEERSYARLIRFTQPLVVKMNGKLGRGVILKPE